MKKILLISILFSASTAFGQQKVKDGSVTNEIGTAIKFKVNQAVTCNPSAHSTVDKAGDIYVNKTTGNVYIYNGPTWVSQFTQTGLGAPMFTTPSSTGAVYVNSINFDVYTYNTTSNSWIKANEVLTVLSYTAGTNSLTCKDKAGNTTILNLNNGVLAYVLATNTLNFTDNKGVVTKLSLNNAGLTYDAAANILIFTDNKGTQNTINLAALVQNNQKITTLVDGTNTTVSNSVTGMNTQHKVNVSTATDTTLGLVKETATKPTVTINTAGELAVNLNNLSPLVTKNEVYTALLTNNIILTNDKANDVTITLPSVAGQMGKRYIIKKLNTNEDYYVKVAGSIDGLAIPSNGLSTSLPYTC